MQAYIRAVTLITEGILFLTVCFLDGGHSDCGEIESQSSFNLHSSDILIEMMIAQLHETHSTLGDLSGGATIKQSGRGMLRLKGVIGWGRA